MKFKLKKVCTWIVFVQMFLFGIHLSFYHHFTKLDNFTHLVTSNPVTTRDKFINTSRDGILKQRQINGGTQNPKTLHYADRNNSDRRLNESARETVRPREAVQKDSNVRNIHDKRNARSQISTVRKCRDISCPLHMVKKDDYWQSVGNKTAFLFSAYHVQKSQSIVILGAKPQHQTAYFCLFWQEVDGKLIAEQVYARIKQSPEGHTLWFSAVSFECRVQSDIPSYVTLATTSCGIPENLLQVHNTTPPEKYERRFTVCLTPLNTNYSRAYELVEWIELNRILGAEKFIIYNYSSAGNIFQVLEYYSKKNIVEVVQWRLPMSVQTDNGRKQPEIHYYGQLVSLQDCLYRNKMTSEFIVNIDLDEFIIPHGKDIITWNDMLKQLNNVSGAFIFRNTFFRKEWENIYLNDKEIVDKFRLVTLQKLYRESYIFPTKRRSKYFARTCDVSQVMIHDVLFLPRKKMAKVVDPETGLLHHYRDWESASSLPKLKVLNDTIPQKYGDILIKNVDKIWSKLANVKMDFFVP